MKTLVIDGFDSYGEARRAAKARMAEVLAEMTAHGQDIAADLTRALRDAGVLSEDIRIVFGEEEVLKRGEDHER